MTRFRSTIIGAGAALVLVVQACSPSGDTGKASDSASAAARPADSAASPPVTGAPPAGTAIATGNYVALDGAGVMLVAAESGSTQTIAFGTPVEAALTAIAGVLGDPIVRTTNRDCGAGPLQFIAFDGGLFVGVQNNRFVGWTVRPSGGKSLRTMTDIGIGSTRAQLDAAYNVRVTRSSIGTEFMAGGLQGVLASDSANAPITDLWAGANCVGR